MTENTSTEPPSIDQARIEELSGLLGDTVQELIDEFLTACTQELEQLERAIDGGQNDRIFALCHDLKSTAGNLGFLRLHEQCKQLELQARANQLVDAAGQYSAIKAELESLKKQLRA